VNSPAFIAVDWGTSSRRAYRIVDRVSEATFRDDLGARQAQAIDYPAEIAAIRAALGDLPMLLAGMVGSSIGWRAVPYVATPVRIDHLAAALDWIDPRTAIVPGVSWRDGDRGDVMRGEEVQLLGAVAAGLAPAEGLLSQPGTHCKWVRIQGAAIASFTTAMTGELFALLRNHSLLETQIQSEVTAGPAFLDGVAEGARRDLGASLFGIRARSLLGLGPDDPASYASGLLIGADVGARVAPGETVHILADPALGALYRCAIEALGGQAVIVDSHDAFVAGIVRIRELADDQSH